MAWLSLALTVLFGLVDGLLPNLAFRRRTGRPLVRSGAGASGWTALAWVGTVFISGPVAGLAGLGTLWSNPALTGVGLASALAGLTIVKWAQRSMGESLRIGIDPEERTCLVTKGVFGVIRNPIYSAMMLYAAGTTAIVPNIVSLTALTTFAVTMEFQVRRVEEPFLVQIHGPDYREYLARVGRFIPIVGRQPV